MSIKNSVTIAEVVEYLNGLIEADPLAMRAFMCIRIPCNKELADHPTAQVNDWREGYTIGLIGILNGIFGIDDRQWGAIGYTIPDDKNEFKFMLIEQKENR